MSKCYLAVQLQKNLFQKQINFFVMSDPNVLLGTIPSTKLASVLSFCNVCDGRIKPYS